MIRCIAFHVSPTPFFHFERTNTSISTSGVIFDGEQKREKKKKRTQVVVQLVTIILYYRLLLL